MLHAAGDNLLGTCCRFECAACPALPSPGLQIFARVWSMTRYRQDAKYFFFELCRFRLSNTLSHELADHAFLETSVNGVTSALKCPPHFWIIIIKIKLLWIITHLKCSDLFKKRI